MSIFRKLILILFLLGLILTLGLLILLPRHLPAWLSAQASTWLQQQGFTPADLNITRLTLSELTLGEIELGQHGVHADIAELNLQYTFGSLRRQEIESLTLDQAHLSLDIPTLLQSLRELPPTDAGATPIESITLPLAHASIRDSSITLNDGDWHRQFALQAQLDRFTPAQADLSLNLQNAQDTLTVNGTLDTAPIVLATTFHFHSQAPLSWLDLPPTLTLPVLPPEISPRSGPLSLEGALRYTLHDGLQRWALLAALSQPHIAHPLGALSASLINGGASGQALTPEKIWLGIFEAQLYQPDTPHRLTLDSLTLQSQGPNLLTLDTSSWQLNSHDIRQNSGEINLKAGPIHARLHGPWASPHLPGALDAFTLNAASPASRFSLESTPLSLSGQLAWEARLQLEDMDTRLHATLNNIWLQYSLNTLSADSLTLEAQGQLPGPMQTSLAIQNGHASWTEGNGNLSGIHGKLQLSTLLPPSLPGPQQLRFAELSQGEIALHDGLITLDYSPPQDGIPANVTATLGGTFAGGTLEARVLLHQETPLRAEASLILKDLSLEQLANYFPEFQGKIQGRVSGQIPIHLEGSRLILLPGYLRLSGDEPGRLQYTQQGWLTQDRNLNPSTYVQNKDLLTLMNEPNGAAILTEYAMRDLNMTAFSLEILPPGRSTRRATIHIKGDSTLHGVTIPVIQDINLGEDLKETLNILLRLQERARF